MISNDTDILMRLAAFERVRLLSKMHDHLTQKELRSGFVFDGQRVPLVNPQRGIFKPRSMRYLLSIRTVFPRPGGRVWYDDQREVHRQIFEGDDAIDYAFMGNDPNAADNQWLRAAYENRIPVIYFLGIAPGRYQAIVPVYVAGWDAKALKARIVFGTPDQQELVAPQGRPGAPLCASHRQAAASPGVVPRGGDQCLSGSLFAFRTAGETAARRRTHHS